MTNTHRAFLALSALLFAFAVHAAFADQLFYNEPVDRQATRACAFDAATVQKVSVSATTAKTSSATGVGQVRVLCSARSFMVVGAVGATGVTATTGGITIPTDTPEYFYSKGSLFAFIRDTANGTCEVAECK